MVEIGETYGIYTVIGKTNEKYSDGHKLWVIQCEKCKRVFKKPENQFASPSAIANTCTHDYFQWGPEFRGLGYSYRDMIERCYKPKKKDAKSYKDKGIIVCDEWLNNPESFKKWSIENGWEPGLSIDRIDSDKNYCPENCRWITRSDNSKYKSTTRCLTVNGVTHTGKDWARELGLGINRINAYVREFGEDAVIEYIAAKLKDPTINKTFLQNLKQNKTNTESK